MNALIALVAQATPTVTITETSFGPLPRSGGDTVIAILAIAFALAAGVVGYRIIKGGRGL